MPLIPRTSLLLKQQSALEENRGDMVGSVAV